MESGENLYLYAVMFKDLFLMFSIYLCEYARREWRSLM